MGLLSSLGGIGGITSGIGNLVGAAGSIYGALQDPPNPYKNYPSKPFTGLISTPGYTFGGGQLLSSNNNQTIAGQQALRGQVAGLQSQVQPGYGKLTEAGVNAIRQQGAQASGNLRAQLAQRGLSGASFAQDQLASVANQYSQLENEFRTQAFQQELQASTALIDKTQTSLTNQASQELSALGIATGFLNSVPQAMQTQKSIDQALAQHALLDKYQNAQAPGGTGTVPSTGQPLETRPVRSGNVRYLYQ
jgi:hypothetical protein